MVMRTKADCMRSYLNDLRIADIEECAEWGDNSAVGHVEDVFGLSRDGNIRHGPRGFLLGLEISAIQQMNDQRHESCVNDGLNLLLVAGGDVGDEPNCLLKAYGLSRLL